MRYTPEITEMMIVTPDGDQVAVLDWIDECTIEVKSKSILTNAADWPDLSAAIQAALTTMEKSTRTHQEKVNT